jgi:hypothetical protein
MRPGSTIGGVTGFLYAVYEDHINKTQDNYFNAVPGNGASLPKHVFANIYHSEVNVMITMLGEKMTFFFKTLI